MKQYLRLVAVLFLSGASVYNIIYATDEPEVDYIPTTEINPVSESYPSIPRKTNPSRFAGAYYMVKPTSMTHQWYSIYNYEKAKPSVARRPLLGYSSGNDTEAMDWQIKWAVEGGLKYWVFNSYWSHSQGGDAIYDESIKTFMGSNYANHLNFAVMIDNIEARSKEEARDVFINQIATSFSNNYLSKGNYLKFNYKPAIYIYNIPAVFRTSPTDTNFIKSALAEFERRVGQDIFWVYATPGVDENLNRYQNLGFNAIHPYYIIPTIANATEPIPYRRFVRDQLAAHAKYLAGANNAGLKYIPSVTINFDERNRYLNEPHLVNKSRYTKNPSKEVLNFLLTEFDKSISQNNSSQLIKGLGKEVIGIGAWNEWIEGNYLEPGRSEFDANDPYYLLRTTGEVLLGTNFVPNQTPAKDYSVDALVSKNIWNFGSKNDISNWYSEPRATDLKVVEAGRQGETSLEVPFALQLLAKPNIDGVSKYKSVEVNLNASCAETNCLESIILHFSLSNCAEVDAKLCAIDRTTTQVDKGVVFASSSCQLTGNLYKCTFPVASEFESISNDFTMEQMSITIFPKTQSRLHISLGEVKFLQ